MFTSLVNTLKSGEIVGNCLGRAARGGAQNQQVNCRRFGAMPKNELNAGWIYPFNLHHPQRFLI